MATGFIIRHPHSLGPSLVPVELRSQFGAEASSLSIQMKFGAYTMHHHRDAAAVVGLGELGQNLSMRLSGGRTLYLHDKTNDVLASSVQVTGGIGIASLRNLPQDCPVVFLCPPAYLAEEGDDEEQILAPLPPGTTVLDMRPTVKAKSLDLCDRAARRGLKYAEAAVLGGPKLAALGELTIAVGGTSDSFALALPYLDELATLVVHTGDVGTATRAVELQRVMSALTFAAAHEVVNASAEVNAQALMNLLASSSRALGDELQRNPQFITAEFDSADALRRAVHRLYSGRRA
ncbi:NAD(P)-binding domain-containing protein [Arthrobacter sp. MI7-26]|uniref:NAD(P)-binding domain-containing protein n=1 Tax=Arthrobacter sp. MI7-26 TaxID=2993653 RepID=UPI0022491D44|nr:NAD(P)-binding domain-containing protein [Arthrobacter sp. MI7-26]MCX2750446.1 NAD(P)-binding domain-containing protein [Arthrobacter sp. MI7-26]